MSTVSNFSGYSQYGSPRYVDANGQEVPVDASVAPAPVSLVPSQDTASFSTQAQAPVEAPAPEKKGISATTAGLIALGTAVIAGGVGWAMKKPQVAEGLVDRKLLEAAEAQLKTKTDELAEALKDPAGAAKGTIERLQKEIADLRAGGASKGASSAVESLTVDEIKAGVNGIDFGKDAKHIADDALKLADQANGKTAPLSAEQQQRVMNKYGVLSNIKKADGSIESVVDYANINTRVSAFKLQDMTDGGTVFIEDGTGKRLPVKLSDTDMAEFKRLKASNDPKDVSRFESLGLNISHVDDAGHIRVTFPKEATLPVKDAVLFKLIGEQGGRVTKKVKDTAEKLGYAITTDGNGRHLIHPKNVKTGQDIYIFERALPKMSKAEFERSVTTNGTPLKDIYGEWDSLDKDDVKALNQDLADKVLQQKPSKGKASVSGANVSVDVIAGTSTSTLQRVFAHTGDVANNAGYDDIF